MPVVEELNGEQEEVMEEGCEQHHEKGMYSQCSLKVTWLLQQKTHAHKNGFFHFLVFYAITDMDLIKFWAKESCCFCFFAFLLKMPQCLRGGLGNEA